MKLRTLRALRSDFRSDVFYPVGSEAVLVEPLDEGRDVWLVEVRIPDESLVGGASFDVVQANLDDLEVVVTEAALAEDMRRADDEAEHDRTAARAAGNRDVVIENGARRAPREMVMPHSGP